MILVFRIRATLIVPSEYNFEHSEYDMRSLRLSFFLTIGALLSLQSFAQNSPLTKSLEFGSYMVGFKTELHHDYTRNYLSNVDPNTNEPVSDYKPRPMQIAVWYPAKSNSGTQLKIRDYLYTSASRDTIARLNDRLIHQLDSIFVNQTSFLGALNKEGLKRTLDIPTSAYFDASPEKGSFPVIIYSSAQSNGIFSNTVLCELLASHGYIVVTTPPKPTGSLPFYDATLGDIKFLRGYVQSLKNADLQRIGAVGYADVFSALALAQNDFSIKAVAGLVNNFGTPFYNTTKQNHPYLDEYNLRVPFMNITGTNYQLVPNNIAPSFDKVVYTNAYSLQFKDAVPVSFSSEFMLRWILNLDNPNQGIFYNEDASLIAFEWMNKYVLAFLNAYVKDSKEDLRFLKQTDQNTEITTDALSLYFNEALTIPPTDAQFRNIVQNVSMEEAYKTWKTTKADNPNYVVMNGSGFLNFWGYQLIGQGNYSDAITAFEINATDFTTDPNLLDSWGEGLLAAGKKEEAAEKFKQVLNWNPPAPQATLDNSISLLRELGFKVDSSGNVDAVPGNWEPSLDPQPMGERKNDNLFNGVQAFDDPTRVSPNRKVSGKIGDIAITVEYGAPSVKGRTLVGGLIPGYRTWRTGANEATVITFDENVYVEGKPVPKGSYGLFASAGEEKWTLILNRDYAQWGAFTYNANDDFLRANVPVETRDHVEEMKFSFEKNHDESTILVLRWGTLAIPFTITAQ